jgi:hypothetical protein
LDFSWKFKYSKIELGGIGTQTSALAFGGARYSIYSSNRRMAGAGSPLTVTITAS